jgi:hypothetical protein
MRPSLLTGLAILAVAIIAGGLWLNISRHGPRNWQPPVSRGEPINQSPTVATISNGQYSGQSQTAKPRHPRPASFQKRMVEFQLNQSEGVTSLDTQTFGGNAASVIFNAAQLQALPQPKLPSGFEWLGFDTLSGFPFEVTRQMVDSSTNASAASAATLAAIPRAVQELDQRAVAVRGFLLPLKMNNGLAIGFLLMRNQNMCCFGTVPKINEWIMIDVRGEGTKPVMDQPITVLGKLRVAEIRENGYLVGIYHLEAEKILGP